MGSGISKLNGFLIVERLAVCRLTERLCFLSFNVHHAAHKRNQQGVQLSMNHMDECGMVEHVLITLACVNVFVLTEWGLRFRCRVWGVWRTHDP